MAASLLYLAIFPCSYFCVYFCPHLFSATEVDEARNILAHAYI